MKDLSRHGKDRSRPSRRQFLQRTGAAGAAVLGADLLGQGEVAPAAAQALPGGVQVTDGNHFGRLFANLPYFGRDLDQNALRAALVDIGKPGGIMDAGDDIAAGPVNLITDPALSAHNPNNPTHTAGTTFFGQFVDHDITFDLNSRLGIPTNPAASPNLRTPALDLDSLYGGGPPVSPHLYEETRFRFVLENGGLYEDVPRTRDGVAIIADFRNDENLMVSGLVCAFMLFHNAAIDWVLQHRSQFAEQDVYSAARRLTTWHYQWMIVHEYLPLIVGQPMIDTVLGQGRRFYRPPFHVPFMPVEFQAACYRMGHSMVRPSYRANFTGNGGNPFFGFVFDPTAAPPANPTDPDDLSGGHRAPRRFIGWHTFFDFGDGNVKPNKKIDTVISSPLFHLPLQAIPVHTPPTALPQRTLLRQITWTLPSGQDLAVAVGAPPLTPDHFPELTQYGLGLERRTPLWYYILREAEVLADGLTLGPAGGRVVAEVLLGLLQLDPNSHLHAGWEPTLPRANGSFSGEFGMVDFLTFAGVGGQR